MARLPRKGRSLGRSRAALASQPAAAREAAAGGLPKRKRVAATGGVGCGAKSAKPAWEVTASSALSAKTWSSTEDQER